MYCVVRVGTCKINGRDAVRSGGPDPREILSLPICKGPRPGPSGPPDPPAPRGHFGPFFYKWPNAETRTPPKPVQTDPVGRDLGRGHRLHRWNGLGRARCGQAPHPPGRLPGCRWRAWAINFRFPCFFCQSFPLRTPTDYRASGPGALAPRYLSSSRRVGCGSGITASHGAA